MLIYLGTENLRIHFRSGKILDVDGHTGEAHFITITPAQNTLCFFCGHGLAMHTREGCTVVMPHDAAYNWDVVCACKEAIWSK